MVKLTVFKEQSDYLIKIQNVSIKGCEDDNLEEDSERNFSFST
jgi:hypothetical protein